MVDHDDDEHDNIDISDEHDGSDHDDSPVDLFGAAIALCQVAQRAKTVEAALKRLRKIGRDTLVAEQKLAAIEARAVDTAAALAERAAELDARAAEIERREIEFGNLRREAHEHLRGFYDGLAQEDRRIRFRILSHADLLHGYNERLQELPSWQQIKQMIPGLPADLPAGPVTAIVSENVREDWAGNVFAAGATVTRSINKAASQ
jgi:hypothetical protein